MGGTTVTESNQELCREFAPDGDFRCDYPRKHFPIRVSTQWSRGVALYAHGSQLDQVWWGPIPAVAAEPEPVPVEKTHRERAEAALKVALTKSAANASNAPGTQIMVLMGIGEALLALEEAVRALSAAPYDEGVAAANKAEFEKEAALSMGCKSVRDGQLPCPERFNRGERSEDRARWCRFCKATVPDYDPKPRNYEQERGF